MQTGLSVTTVLQPVASLMVPHLYWYAMAHGSSNGFPVSFNTLIDYGSHLVLIDELFV
jgi:hypothetical protein